MRISVCVVAVNAARCVKCYMLLGRYNTKLNNHVRLTCKKEEKENYAQQRIKKLKHKTYKTLLLSFDCIKNRVFPQRVK